MAPSLSPSGGSRASTRSACQTNLPCRRLRAAATASVRAAVAPAASLPACPQTPSPTLRNASSAATRSLPSRASSRAPCLSCLAVVASSVARAVDTEFSAAAPPARLLDADPHPSDPRANPTTHLDPSLPLVPSFPPRQPPALCPGSTAIRRRRARHHAPSCVSSPARLVGASWASGLPVPCLYAAPSVQAADQSLP